MSTRSGKRIHSSFHANIIKVDVENAAKSERKTRSKKVKENLEETASVLKSKKRNNYVSYPTDDEGGTEVDHKEDEGKTRSRKNALKERNTIHTAEPEASEQKSVRTTRRTRKISEPTEELQEKPQRVSNKNEVPKVKSKKKKKSTESQETEETKKIKKKKKGKRSGSIIVEDIEPEGSKNMLNKSSMSVDSFHSAAGSPLQVEIELPDDMQTMSSTPLNVEEEKPGRKTRSGKVTKKEPEHFSRKRKSSGITKDTSLDNDTVSLKDSKRHKKDTDVQNDTETSFEENTLTEQNVESTEKINTTLEEEDFIDLNNSRRSTRKSKTNETFEKIENTTVTSRKSVINTTYDKDFDERLSIKNSTFDKDVTFDKDTFDKRKSIKDTTFEKDAENKDTTFDKNETFDKDSNSTFDKSKSVKDTTFDKNGTFDKDSNSTFEKRNSVKDTTFDKNATFEKDSTFDKKSVKDSTFDKDTVPVVKDTTFEKDAIQEDSLNQKDSTLDKNTTNNRKSIINITFEKDDIQTNTAEKDNKKPNTKLNTTFNRNSKSSLISSDNSNITLDKSDISQISITSDDSKENIDNIINTTPVLIESSLDESKILEKSPIIAKTPDTTVKSPITPLKREGTFTKDEATQPERALQPDVLPRPVEVLKTPTKTQRRASMPSPGRTPFPNKSTQERVLNITRSIEKRRSSVADAAPRATKVMFCSPGNNPAAVAQQRRKVIKSNLKGSNKSFVFDDSAIEPRPARKRSYTQSDADDLKTKRKRLAYDTQHTSKDRLSRSRTSSASAKLTQTTPNKTTPSKAKITRTKLPNFAALHQKQFAKMESLDECQERKAKRAKHLLTPTGSVTVLERTSVSPNEPEEKPNPQPSSEKPKASSSKKQTKEEPKKPETPIKSLPTLKSLNPGYSRFGFRLNLDVNPFTFTTKTDAVKSKEKRPNFTRQATAPSLNGGTSLRRENGGGNGGSSLRRENGGGNGGSSLRRENGGGNGATSLRREEAKRAIMREKSFTDKRSVNRNENRTIIKGVRTNRRFELQMKMRNIE